VYSFQRSIPEVHTTSSEPIGTEGCGCDGNNRWRSQVAAKRGRAATFGGNAMKRYADVKEAIERT
jgi:hypothetical protein